VITFLYHLQQALYKVLPDEVPGFDVQQRNHHEQSVEDADARKITERPEVGNAFCLFLVEDPEPVRP